MRSPDGAIADLVARYGLTEEQGEAMRALTDRVRPIRTPRPRSETPPG